MKQVLKIALGIVLGFVLLVVGCTALILETDNGTDDVDNPTTQEEKVKEEPVKEDKEEPAEEPKEEAQEPVAQEEEAVEEEVPETAIPEEEAVPFEYEQALKSAQNYVDTLHFSRQGLKQQLTSEYGSGFSEEAAEYALEHVDVDYKEEAVEAAQSYLDAMSFSREGLKQQLTSEYGSGFTEEEAEYALDQVYK